MRYLKKYKLFESVDNFPDVFNDTLIRGVKLDKDEFVDDPKTRKVSLGSSDDEDYRAFIANYAKLGIPDPTESVHMYFKPTRDLFSTIKYYGTSYRVIPEKGALFGFNKELRNGGLGSTWFFYDRISKDFLNKTVNKFPSFHDNKEEFIKAITDYQQDLIDGGVIGVLTYDELLKMSDKELDTLQVWTESPCLHKKYVSKPKEKDNKAYNNQPVLTKDDFINLGVDPSRIPEFYQSEFGVKIKRFKDVSFVEKRKEALRLLNDWLKTFESI
jgi:hypothetical protein